MGDAEHAGQGGHVCNACALRFDKDDRFGRASERYQIDIFRMVRALTSGFNPHLRILRTGAAVVTRCVHDRLLIRRAGPKPTGEPITMTRYAVGDVRESLVTRGLHSTAYRDLVFLRVTEDRTSVDPMTGEVPGRYEATVAVLPLGESRVSVETLRIRVDNYGRWKGDGSDVSGMLLAYVRKNGPDDIDIAATLAVFEHG